MKTLNLTPSQIYKRKQNLWRKYCRFAETVRRAFFPDTGGVSLYLHNWYICAEKTNPEGAKLAQWLENSTYARYKRIEAKLEADSVEREHHHGKHAPRGFAPLWCPICNPKSAAGYGYTLRDGKWQKV